jgi:ELWxxDGT repeat protein
MAELDGQVVYAYAGQTFVLDDATRTLVSRVAPILDFVPFQGALYFMGGNATDGYGLWRTDLSAEGTELVRALGTTARPLATLGDHLVFWASDAQAGIEVWVSDGTSGGTRRVADAHPGTANSMATLNHPMSEIDGALYFGLNDGQHGDEPWRLRRR